MTELNPDTVDVSVVIPTYRRVDDLVLTLNRVLQCQPAPDEILVHIDFGDTETGSMLAQHFPAVRVLLAEFRSGPGGGRNRLIREARHSVIVSLDDDSWPVDVHFFAKAHRLMAEHDEVGIIACHILERDSPAKTHTRGDGPRDAGEFVGCGAIVRREAFLQTNGYLPLAQAYGMEESDVSLQLLSFGWRIVYADDMAVFHNCDRTTRHATESINAAQIRNIALLAFLRYPLICLPLGILQVGNRILFCLRVGRYRGILRGLFSIPGFCLKFRNQRRPVSYRTLSLIRTLRRA